MIYFAMLAKQFVDCESLDHLIETVQLVNIAYTAEGFTDAKKALAKSVRTTIRSIADDDEEQEEILSEVGIRFQVVDKAFHKAFHSIRDTMGNSAHITPDHVAMMVAMTKA